MNRTKAFHEVGNADGTTLDIDATIARTSQHTETVIRPGTTIGDYGFIFFRV